MYLITGATGNIGGRLVELLLDQGQQVRAFVRDPDRAHDFPDSVDVVVGDLDDAASVDAATKGVDGIFHMQASHGGDQTATMIRAAQSANVPRIVALSSIGAVLDPMPTMGTWFRAREDLLRDSGLDVTYLRPNTLMTNALWWVRSIKESGSVTDPCGPGRMSCVDTDDIAAVAAVALTEPGHGAHGYILTGPQALTTREQVEILADVLGQHIEFVETTPAAFADSAVRAGTAPEAADAIENLNDLFRAGRAGILTDDVYNVTGHAPGTFREWCQRHTAAFR